MLEITYGTQALAMNFCDMHGEDAQSQKAIAYEHAFCFAI